MKNRNLYLIIIGWLMTCIIGGYYRCELIETKARLTLSNDAFGALERHISNRDFRCLLCQRLKQAEDYATPEPEFVLTGTMYHAVKGQTDGSPLTTADNSKIDLQKLYDNELRWVALSRDLLDRWGGPFNYGDRIMVEGVPMLRNGYNVNGVWEVHDTMNARYTRYIDFLMPAHVKRNGEWVHSPDFAGPYYFKQDGVSIHLIK